MAGERVAWDYQESQRAWRSYRAGGLRWLAAAVSCAVLVIGGAQLVLARSQQLLDEGAATTATVRSADAQSVTFDYDAGGRSYTETLDVVSGRQYATGEQMEVRYHRADPATVRLLDEPRRIPGVGPALVVLTLVGLAAVPTGIGVTLRALAWRRAMRREPWSLARLRVRGAELVLQPSDSDSASASDSGSGSGRVIRARMLATSRWRTKAVQGMDGRELWILPVGTRTLVLTADGAGTLYGLRRTRPRP